MDFFHRKPFLEGLALNGGEELPIDKIGFDPVELAARSEALGKPEVLDGQGINLIAPDPAEDLFYQI
ncbi:MAG: hypothetical protein ACXAEI_14275, partial [Candidatus Hodarchaeales archaeon]